MIALRPKYPKYLDVVVAAKDRMVRVWDWKLSYQPLGAGAPYKLFNIVDDPGCQSDVLHQHPDMGATLRAILRATLEQWMGVEALRRA